MKIREIEASMNDMLATAGDPRFFGRDGTRLFPCASAGARNASHEVFRTLTRHIEGHLLPSAFFLSGHGEDTVPENLTVISLAFHIDRRIVEENSRENLYPTYSWFEARQKFDMLYPSVIEIMRGAFPGRRIVVPVQSPLYRANLVRTAPEANWSERHVAFACGLGTFGLHGALITGKGCTHRLLSVIVDADVEGSVDPPDNPYQACRHFADGSCGECASRCPAGAIVPGTHIIERCYDHEWMTCRLKSKEIYGTEVPACGLCMCGVPCDTSGPG